MMNWVLSFKLKVLSFKKKLEASSQLPEAKTPLRQAQGDSKFNVIVSLSNLDTDKVWSMNEEKLKTPTIGNDLDCKSKQAVST